VPGTVYPLSMRIASLCARTYTGIYRSDRDLRSYRCQGKRGSPSCDCPWYDADPLEARVWEAVCELLGDPGRLTGLAGEYLAIETGRAVSQADELARLREQIAQRRARLQADVAAYLRAGAEAEAAATATRQQQDELAALERRRDDIERTLGDSAAQASALDQVAGLAQHATGRLATMGAEDRAEVIRLLDIKVAVLDDGRAPSLQISGVVSDLALLDDASHVRDVHPSSIEA
jgi:Recombinase zinc beta ribbon domain